MTGRGHRGEEWLQCSVCDAVLAPGECAAHMCDASWVRCYACPGSFSLSFKSGTPVALHSDTPCAAFDVISTTADAALHAERCRAALKPS